MTPTEIAKKLKSYLDDNGIRYGWFCEKVGISNPSLSGYLGGYKKLPKKCLKNVVIVTKGKITMKELLSEFFNDLEAGNVKEDESHV